MLWLTTLMLVPIYGHVIGPPQNITGSSPCTDRNHLIIAPGVLAAGGSSRACVSRFHPEGPARMLMTLHTEDGELVSATRDLPPGDGGCLDIAVPLKPNTKVNLNVNLRYHEANCVWSGRLPLRIASAKAVVVHAERARYRPGDTVRVRVVALKADLTPAHGYVDEIWIEGPRGIWDGARAVQWRRVRTRLGLAQVQHQLDDLAPPGRWSVRARFEDGSQGAATFLVGNYDLPPFQLTVRHAPRVLRTSDRLVWTVCVRYPWSEAVEGMLVIRLRGAGGGAGGAGGGAGGVRTAVRLKAPRACHRHAAAARRVGFDGTSAPDVVVADFSFQEDGTRVWQNTTVVSQVVADPVTLEFLTKYRAVISPGLPYKLKVKATRWDDKPAAHETVRVCRMAVSALEDVSDTAVPADATCTDGETDARGVARVLFDAEHIASPFYRFVARLNNATASLRVASRAAAAHAALGPLRADGRARTLVPLYLNLGNVTAPVTVHFVVITRGGIIYRWGATTQCPHGTTTNQILTAPRNSTCQPLNPKIPQFSEAKNFSDVDTLLDKHLLRVMLPIKVSNQMCPDSRVVAYFYHQGELVSASKHFETEECFGNKVEANWLVRQTPPGSLATIQLSTPGPALCALSVLDTAAKWLQPGETIRDVVMLALRRLIDAHRNLTEHDAAGECFLSSDMPEVPHSSMELMTSWLAAAGVRASGEQARCGQPPALLVANDVFTPRSDFSEAWLWRLVAVGGNGTASATARTPDSITRFEASAYCLSRTGIGIAQPAVLQVFREFFVHADGPRRLRRGDRSVVRYRIFNYLYEPISVQIQILTDPHIESASATETACLAGRSSAARRLDVRARLAGEARLAVRARAARGGCGNYSGPAVSDEVIIKIQIDQEGIPVREHKSIMLCAAGTESAAPPSVTWSWDPVSAVPGTEALAVWAAGDVAGPLLADADGLVTLPRGCGEQNMARLATNLLALGQLDPRSTAYAAAKDHVARGFTRQLQYAHRSGGFSAFGPSDPSPSTWLTAFCVRYLRRAYQVISPGLEAPPALERAERWLLARQTESGCFRSEGQVFHRELKGGLSEEGEIANIALTAYVITSLTQSSASIPAGVVRSALSCLRAFPRHAKAPARVYAHALLAYAFVTIRRYEEDLKRTNEAALEARLEENEETQELMQLMKVARRGGDYVWWEGATLASSVEATGYALLALAQCGAGLRAHAAAHAAAAALWLHAHRSPTGGFVATQDTLVALEGLAQWSSIQAPASNLSVTARARSSRTVTLMAGSRLPDVISLEPADQLHVDVEGMGCALVQATRSYRVVCEECEQRGTLSVQVSVRTEGRFDCDRNDTHCYCAAVVEACVVWTGAFPEMALLEVSLPGGYAADAPRLYAQLRQSDLLLRRIELTPSGGKATLYLAGGAGGDAGGGSGGSGGHRCYSVHAAGPRAPTAPAHASVLDYYAPDRGHSQMYVIPEDCPPAISHETSDYLPSDNLFTKAKSLDDDGEILITHDFAFEDIPEGVPLDDPMYDNLTRKDKDDDETMIDNIKEISDEKSNNNLKTNIKNNYTAHTEDGVSNRNKILGDKQVNNIPKILDLVKNNANDSDNEILKDITYDLNNKSDTVLNKDHNEITNLKPGNNKDIVLKTHEDIKIDTEGKNVRKGNEVKIAVKAEELREKLQVANPMLSDFHVIDSEKDLDVPTGVEGPLPTVVLPPKDFVFVSPETGIHSSPQPEVSEVSRRQFPRVPAYDEKFFLPYYSHQTHRQEQKTF